MSHAWFQRKLEPRGNGLSRCMGEMEIGMSNKSQSTPMERYEQMKCALEGIVRGCEAVLLDAELAEQDIHRGVLKKVLDNAREGLRGVE